MTALLLVLVGLALYNYILHSLPLEQMEFMTALLLVLLGLALAAFRAARQEYRHLPAPGICLPFLGHIRVRGLGKWELCIAGRRRTNPEPADPYV
jgi:hypothetical protein